MRSGILMSTNPPRRAIALGSGLTDTREDFAFVSAAGVGADERLDDIERR
jgi:hypothetical protein